LRNHREPWSEQNCLDRADI